MRTAIVTFISLPLLLSACATAGPRTDTGPGGLPPATWGWNIGAGDLLGPSSAGCRLGVYLDELTTAGYAKQIRIVYTPSVGPFVLQHWVPVIRAKGFRVLAILYQSRADSDVDRQRDWILTGLPVIADILDGVQIANEVDRTAYNDFSPAEYWAFHRYVAMVVRSTLPGVKIVGPDIQTTESSVRFLADSGLVYGQDYNIVSVHITGVDRLDDIQRYVREVRRLTGQQKPRVWITEGDWGQADALSREGLVPGRSYVYVWNCNPTGKGSACEPQTRRPAGASVPQCAQP